MNVTEQGDMFYCDCGFSWRRGHSGAHDCGKGLRSQRDELLAALEKAFPDLDKIDRHCLGWPFVSEPVEILRAAIARAKGGAA